MFLGPRPGTGGCATCPGWGMPARVCVGGPISSNGGTHTPRQRAAKSRAAAGHPDTVHACLMTAPPSAAKSSACEGVGMSHGASREVPPVRAGDRSQCARRPSIRLQRETHSYSVTYIHLSIHFWCGYPSSGWWNPSLEGTPRPRPRLTRAPSRRPAAGWRRAASRRG